MKNNKILQKIKELFQKKQLILLVLPSKSYTENLMMVIRQFNGQKRLYVTLNNPYPTLMKLYKDNGLENDNCLFIDAISASNHIKVEADNCVFLDSPRALTQLSLAISQSIKTFNPELLIFDSLSTLLIYLPEKSIIAFQQSLSIKLRSNGVKALFPTLENKELIDHISMFVDDVVEWEVEVTPELLLKKGLITKG